MIFDVLSTGERLAGGRDKRMVRGMLYAIGEALTVAAPYAFVLIFILAALDDRLTMRLTWIVTGGIGVAVALRLWLSSAAMANLFIGASAMMGQARLRTADHLRKLPMGYFTEKRSGELAGVLTTDLALVEDLWSHTIGVFAATFALPMLVGVGLCFLNIWLGLIVLVMLPAALFALGVLLPFFTREMEAVLEASADVSARVVEYVQGIAVVRAFGRQGFIYEQLVHAMTKLRDALIRFDVLPSPVVASFGFVVEMAFVLVAWLGSSLAFRDKIAPDVLLVFLVVTVGVVRQVSDLGVSLLMLRTSQRALKRVEGLLEEPVLAEPLEVAPPITRFDVQLKGVSFAYEGTHVLHDIHVTFPERSLTALVGHSGSGKSTLVHLVARLWDVPRDNGSICIGGVDIRDVPFEDLHRHIAMVFQDVVLFSGTILDNIRVGKPDATREEIEQAAKAANAHTFITALPDGYETVLGEGGGTLSGGERQRITIARAILKDAPIVLLDEATASVDASAEVEIQRAIHALVKKKTVVVIAHRLRTVRRAHQIVVLDKGRVAEGGTHEELIEKNGLYAALWHEQDRARGWHLGHAVER